MSVQILAVVGVLALAGMALAAEAVLPAFSLSSSDDEVEAPQPVAGLEPLELEHETATAASAFGQARSAEVRAFGACMREATDHDARAACLDLKPGPAWEHPLHPRWRDVLDGDVLDGINVGAACAGVEDDVDGLPFGCYRSFQVRVGCTGLTGEELEACEDMRGPAWKHPRHPVFGEEGKFADDESRPGGGPAPRAGGKDKGVDGATSEEEPPGRAGPPDHAGPPAHAGPPDHAGGPPGR